MTDENIGEEIPDCPPFKKKVDAEIEKAYRRGFCQGVSATRQWLEAGMRHGHLIKWEFDFLFGWRYESQGWMIGDQVMPEDPPKPPKDFEE